MTHLIGRGRYGRETYARRPDGGSSFVSSPLTAQFWVDSDTTVPLASRNGAIGTPFGSIQAAYDAAAAAPFDSVQIIVARSDPAENLVFGSAVICTVIALNFFSSFGFGSNYQAQINDVTVTAGTLALESFIVLGDITSTVPAIGLLDCSHLGNLSATDQVAIRNTTIAAAGGTINVGGTFTFLDEQSEFTTMLSSGQAWVSAPEIRSNGGGPNTAGIYLDADVPAETFSGSSSRSIWPANTITAPRTVTLDVGGGGDFATGYVDVYTQDFDVMIDDAITGNLVTIPSASPARRYGFQLPDATSWVNFRSERL